jgi:hypothetical protein
LLESWIDHFITRQLEAGQDDWYYPHSMMDHFHKNWNLVDVNQLASTYDTCLWSDISQRWWKRENYRPKEIMIKLIRIDPELAMIAWKDLANESATLDGRLYRFNYYCEQLLEMYRKQNRLSIETYHHQDASIMSLYLAGMFPDKYSLYPGLDLFSSFCKKVGSPDIPVVDDLVRYMKVASITYTFLQKNKNFETLLKNRREEFHQVRCIPFLVSYELIAFAGAANQFNL